MTLFLTCFAASLAGQLSMFLIVGTIVRWKERQKEEKNLAFLDMLQKKMEAENERMRAYSQMES